MKLTLNALLQFSYLSYSLDILTQLHPFNLKNFNYLTIKIKIIIFFSVTVISKFVKFESLYLNTCIFFDNIIFVLKKYINESILISYSCYAKIDNLHFFFKIKLYYSSESYNRIMDDQQVLAYLRKQNLIELY